MKLELDATPEEVMRGVAALEEFGEAREIPPKILFGLTLALEECSSNIVNHALKKEPGLKFQVGFSQEGDEIIIELRDSGTEFDPTLADPGDGVADDDEPPGGWGIFLVRKYTDELRYVRENGENVLRLIKRLPEPS
jgi:anti-sigma regulatory factor (Ser/Thr protein kinase)